MDTKEPILILIVDDNAQYREAFKRTLLLEEYAVCEAADADEAIHVMQQHDPDVVVTDLQMRTDREGLDLIERIKTIDPLMPVIMISAVGSFEEGALATQMGATHVIHKSRIEAEMDGFFDTIRQSFQAGRKNREWLALIASVSGDEDLKEGDERIETVRQLLVDPDVDPYVKSEAYDLITVVSAQELMRESQRNMQQASSATSQDLLPGGLQKLKEGLPDYDYLDEDAKQAFATAEYLYAAQEEVEALDFSRSIAFSYCFAVESATRRKLRWRISRLASNADNQPIFESCVDPQSRRLDFYFQKTLHRAIHDRGIRFMMDNVHSLILGLIRRKSKFKGEGLKDAGIILLCFGRRYTFSKGGQTMMVDNPLDVRGLDGDDEVVHLASLLISLQNARNPYIHPELKKKKKEQLSVVREIALGCLNELGKLE